MVWAATGLVVLAALVLTWPLALGHAPATGDHPVHLGRAAAQLQALASGQLRAWWPGWGLGTPVGDLYPPLADWLVAALRIGSLGLLPVPRCYGLAVFIGFTAPAAVLPTVARRLGLSPIAGAIAGLLLIADAGIGREGGWIYTMWLGVWPQALATALQWLCVAELIGLVNGSAAERGRAAARAGMWCGLAVLAHPISLPLLAGWTCVLLIASARNEDARGQVAWAGASLALGVLLAGIWLFPMLSLKGWMASYGWLFQPWSRMVRLALEHFSLTKNMPPSVSCLIALGLVWTILRGRFATRMLALLTALTWLAAGQDWLWIFRPDRLSEAFTHMQYQRFLIAAKPGMFLLAGLALTDALTPTRGAARSSRTPRDVALRGVQLAILLTAIGWVSTDAFKTIQRFKIGTIPTSAIRSDHEFTDDKRALLTWLDEQAEALGRDVRVVFDDGRNVHWLMDAPALARARVWKVGFTPGDNFVHKPEVRRPEVLAYFQPDYVIRRGARSRRGARLAAQFGSIQVSAPPRDPRPPAHIRGTGSVVVEPSQPGDALRLRVQDSAPGDVLVLSIPGFGRWEVTHEGDEIAWEERPMVGDGAGLPRATRQSGLARRGKSLGDDGTEPTLIAVPDVADGIYTLRYVRWRASDVLGLLASLFAVWTLWQARRHRGPRRWLETWLATASARRLVPFAVALCLVAVTITWARGRQRERGHASFELRGIATAANGGLEPGLFKTEMVIGPALIIPARTRGTRTQTWRLDAAPEAMRGWVAIDDDWVKSASRGTHEVAIAALPPGQTVPVEIWRDRIPHAQGKHPIAFDLSTWATQPLELRITVRSSGERPPLAAIELFTVSPGAPG